MTAVHDFRERLAWGESADDDPTWERAYRAAFPDFVSFSRNSGDNTGQRQGVDRWVHLSNGRVLLVDEKKRSQDFADVALEFVSNDRTGAPGWMEKDLQIDFLAYAIVPAYVVYFLPWPTLRRVWRDRREAWKRDYQIIKAPNATYNTISVCVPTPVLLGEIAQGLRVSVRPRPVGDESDGVKKGAA